MGWFATQFLQSSGSGTTWDANAYGAFNNLNIQANAIDRLVAQSGSRWNFRTGAVTGPSQGLP